MNHEVVSGPSLVFYALLVTLLSGIAFVLWQARRARHAPVKARLRRNRATVVRYDR